MNLLNPNHHHLAHKWSHSTHFQYKNIYECMYGNIAGDVYKRRRVWEEGLVLLLDNLGWAVTEKIDIYGQSKEKMKRIFLNPNHEIQLVFNKIYLETTVRRGFVPFGDFFFFFLVTFGDFFVKKWNWRKEKLGRDTVCVVVVDRKNGTNIYFVVEIGPMRLCHNLRPDDCEKNVQNCYYIYQHVHNFSLNI